MNHRVEELAGYEKALHDGATPDEAWTAAFGAQTPANVGAEVLRYVDGGQYALLRYRFDAPKPSRPTKRSLSDAEVHATRALLYLTGERTPRARARGFRSASRTRGGEAKAEVAEALRRESDRVAARAIAHLCSARGWISSRHSC